MKQVFNHKNKLPVVLLLVFITILGFSCTASKKSAEKFVRVSKLPENGEVLDGSLVYALPRTVLNVTLGFSRSVEKPGPYYRFAGDLLGMKDIIQKERETWDLVSVNISTETEADPSEIYVIESQNIVASTLFSLKKSGLILDIDDNAVSGAPSYGMRKVTAAGNTVFSDLGSDEYFLSQSDTAFRVVKLDTTFVRVPYLVERKKQLSLEQLAEKAAKTLLDLREGKVMLLTGETNVYPQDPSAINELNRLEQEYTALFAGKSFTENYTLSVTVIPKNEAGSEQIAWPSRQATQGNDNAAREEIVLSYRPADKTKDITYITRPLTEESDAVQIDKVYYRMPEPAVVTVTAGGRKIYEGRLVICQLGQILQLPSNFLIVK